MNKLSGKSQLTEFTWIKTYHSLVLMWEAKYVSIISHATHGNDFVDVKLYVFAQQSRREL